jgi:cytoskeletal protein CcmA (bactofilin family)
MFKKDGEGSAETIIANGVKVEGDFASPGNVRIEGIVKGSVKADGDLLVTESAMIEADVTAANAIVSGEIRGNITAHDKIELTGTARVHGDIMSKVLTVAAGAVLDGRCQVMLEGTRETAQVRTKQPKAVEA